jgi:hypothetical protein
MKKNLEILDKLLEHAMRGKLCSRYILGLERAMESIKRRSPAVALRQQQQWSEKRNPKKRA